MTEQTREMGVEELQKLVTGAVEDLKAEEPVVLDVRGRTAITDVMVICSGNSNRHVRSIAGNVIDEAKRRGVRPLGVEGEEGGEWVLVDLGDVVVHIMQPKIRELYRLERIWGLEGEEAFPTAGSARH